MTAQHRGVCASLENDVCDKVSKVLCSQKCLCRSWHQTTICTLLAAVASWFIFAIIFAHVDCTRKIQHKGTPVLGAVVFHVRTQRRHPYSLLKPTKFDMTPSNQNAPAHLLVRQKIWTFSIMQSIDLYGYKVQILNSRTQNNHRGPSKHACGVIDRI